MQASERNVGREDYILSDLIAFCNRNCVALPPFRSEKFHLNTSGISLNTCIDESEECTHNLWQIIHTKLKNGIVKLLKSIQLSDKQDEIACPSENIKVYHHRRQHLFELLCCLYPFKDVWYIYCGMREGQLENIKARESIDTVDSNKYNIEDLRNLIDKHIIMINEDTELLLFIKNEEKEVTCLNELLACYSKNAEYHIKEFLRSYELTPGDVINTSILFTKCISAGDLRTFAKLFFIFDNWTLCLKRLVDVFLTFSCEKNQSPSLQDDSHVMQGYELWDWQVELEPFVSVLKKVVPSYIHYIFNVIMMKLDDNKAGVTSNSNGNLKVSKKLLHYGETYPMQVTCVSTLVKQFKIVLLIKSIY